MAHKEKRQGDVMLGAQRQDGRGEPRWLKGARMVDQRKDQKGSQAGKESKDGRGKRLGDKMVSV